MKLGVLFSGGKDSCFALMKAREKDEIACLISLISKNKESYMFHTPNIELVKLQAETISLPIVLKETEGEKEKELEDLKKAIIEAKEKYSIEGIVTGAVESVYQSSRIKKICDELELMCVNPLWKREQETLLREMIKKGMKIIICGVFAEPLDEKWLGRELNEKTIDELVKLREKYKISIVGEGGEIETFVIDAPFFKKRIEIVESEKRYEKNSGVFEIKKARLREK